MSSPNTPRISAPTLDPSQAGAEVFVNRALNFFDLFANVASVINSTTTTPPGSPATGDAYLTGTSCTGAWSGHDNTIALYYGSWQFFGIKPGMVVFDVAGATWKGWDGSAWKTFTVF